MILDKSANELIQKFVWSNSIGEPLIENTTVYKQHCCEEKVPKNKRRESQKIRMARISKDQINLKKLYNNRCEKCKPIN